MYDSILLRVDFGVKMIKHSIYLPLNKIDNDYFSSLYENWDSERVYNQTGIKSRYYAGSQETSGSMGANALEKLIKECNIDKNSIDFIICVTETPDNMLPATAYKIHQITGLPDKCGAYDINHGCAGFTYGLMNAYSMINSGIASNVVLITTDTLSHYLDIDERGTTTLVGDAASAFFIDKNVCKNIMKFTYGTDSSGYDKLIIKHKDDDINQKKYLYMDGMDVFYFAINNVPNIIEHLIKTNNLTMDEIDMIILHQANKTILEYIKKRLKIEDKKFYISLEDTGNTSGSTIPIAINNLVKNGQLKDNMNVLILGFGVGYSWCGTIIRW